MEGFPQRRDGLDMVWIGNRQTGAAAPCVVSDAAPVQDDRQGFQVRGDVDELADRLRVDGIVVGSHPDVVVPRQPDPGHIV